MKRIIAMLILAATALVLCCGCSSRSGSSVPVINTDKQAWQSAELDPDGCIDVVIAAPSTAEPASAPTEVPTEAPTAEPTQTVAPAPTEDPAVKPDPTDDPTDPDNKGDGPKVKVYLTFDDGPSKASNTVLDILNSYGIKGTFFTVGQFVEYNADITRRIVNEGHLLACHTYSHEFSIIYTSPDAFMNDVAKWRSAVTRVVGWDAGSYCIRFPGGSNNPTVGGRQGRVPYVNALHYAGYYAFDWNLAFNDKWLEGNTENLPITEYLWNSYKTTLAMYQNKDVPLIFLIHDDVPQSVELLPRLIEDLLSKGYSFGTVDEIGWDYLF